MGQAPVALPDPLSAAPVNSGNTDDLLAQLAGEEIERLLAEADAPVSAKGSQPPPVASAATAEPASAASSAAAAAPVSAPLRAATPSKSQSSSGPPGEKEDLELDALFTQLDGTGAPAPAAAVGTPDPATATPVPQPEASAAEALAQEMLEDAAVSGRSALASDAPPPTAVRIDEDAAPSPLPIRVLEWVNRPLESCSDQCRELVGKIAILTTVNAAAVLAYVIFFRGH